MCRKSKPARNKIHQNKQDRTDQHHTEPNITEWGGVGEVCVCYVKVIREYENHIRESSEVLVRDGRGNANGLLSVRIGEVTSGCGLRGNPNPAIKQRPEA